MVTEGDAQPANNASARIKAAKIRRIVETALEMSEEGSGHVEGGSLPIAIFAERLVQVLCAFLSCIWVNVCLHGSVVGLPSVGSCPLVSFHEFRPSLRKT